MEMRNFINNKRNKVIKFLLLPNKLVWKKPLIKNNKNKIIKVNNKNKKIFYTRIKFTEIDIKSLKLPSKNFNIDNKNKLDYMKTIFGLENDNKYDELSAFKGVYVFVLNKDLNLTDDFFDDVYLYKKTDENNKVTFEKVYCIASDYKGDERPKNLKMNKVFYCGTSGNIFSRIYEHLTNSSYSGNKSLKLGFDSRKSIRDNLTCYVHLENDETKRSQIEQAIHNQYGYYFGKK